MNKKNKNKIFFYEHFGHMQISVLTLKTFEVLRELTCNKTNVFVPWELVREKIKECGFSERQSEGELERFCYGFECIDSFKNNRRKIALTETGENFLNEIIKETPHQKNQIAFLIRSARRKEMLNVIIQESTFFDPKIYKIISDFKFRQGGARDFLRCFSTNELVELLNLIFNTLSPVAEQSTEFSLQDCINKIEKCGKYWASVGGKYSWVVFPQKFELSFSPEEWMSYDILIKNLLRPPEWNGGKYLAYGKCAELLGKKERVVQFRNQGVIRPIWKNENIENASFCLTAPGYLMWERRKKGFIFEFCVKRISEELYKIILCDASDFPEKLTTCFEKYENNKQQKFLKFQKTGTLTETLNIIHQLTTQTNLF